LLNQSAYDAVHVRELGLQSSADEAVFDRAVDESRVLISADTDFGAVLALRQSIRPSVMLLRGPSQRPPEAQAELILQNLPALAESIDKGSVIVFEETRIRVRMLPITRE
jgi:predicted nuclease of predicted toxin-antitoxin system